MAAPSRGGSTRSTATIRAALNEAKRRKHITENPASLARAPQPDDEEVEPYGVEEIQQILTAANEKRNAARWAIALALGLRQGEVLGLKWSDVDLDAGTLIVGRSRLRPKWNHGCDDTCGRKHPGYCPSRVPRRPETSKTKSRAGRRGVGLPDALVGLLKHHREAQAKERAAACEMWTEGDYVFTSPTGRPLNPSTDYHHWKALLDRAGVPERRLHDARHTAATVLLLLGVPERTVMSVMGWASTAIAARYQHVVAAARRDVAVRIGDLIWKPNEGGGGESPAA